MITKEELIHELVHHSFVVLKPSPLAGVGVFAIRDIPKGCKDIFSKPAAADQWITITREDVSSLPAHVQEMIYTYCLFDDENYFIPAKGFKKMDLSHYINHSDQPNIRSLSDGDFFESLSEIKSGEELLIDYGTIVEDAN